MLIDTHVHSDVSDCSSMPVTQILANARALGLDGVCITDHDTTDVLAQIDEGFQSDGLLVLVGMEYTTPQGDFLVYGDVESLHPGMAAGALIDHVNSMGGAVVAAHPYRGWRPSDPSTIISHPPTAVEVVNGRNTEAEDTLAEALAAKHGFVRVSGSDAHSLDELGRFPIQFTRSISCRNDLVEALRSGHCAPGVGRLAFESVS
ncbi:MAG: histidinol phosphatase [Desulfovibrio sp.]|nr:histidinol phosphatase [Desulfovibrio sp.]|tara:strand:+ start:1702 stop:2313 length:612 start_codon:yes stop_codon:yes gene_type:complete